MSFEAVWKTTRYFKTYCNLHNFSGDITRLNQWCVFDHIARASPVENHRRALRMAIRKHVVGWKRPKRRPRTTWTRIMNNDLAPLNIGLHKTLQKTQDRTGYRLLVATSTLYMEFGNGYDDIYDSILHFLLLLHIRSITNFRNSNYYYSITII